MRRSAPAPVATPTHLTDKHLRALYTVAHYLLLPLLLLRLAWRGSGNPAYWRRWAERFGSVGSVSPGGDAIWVHAVSVGEVQAAVPLIRALQAHYPGRSMVVTTTTPTGSDRVRAALGETVEHRYYPYDLPGSVTRFLDSVRPCFGVLMETELWPNMLAACRRRKVPVVLVNARLSPRSALGYRRVATLAREMLAGLDGLAVQSRADARRLIELGADPERVRVTGSIKFDVRLPASLREEADVLRRCFGVERSVWIAASTHEGEDGQVFDAFERVLKVIPGSLLVVVPRHPERFAGVAALARRRGFAVTRRSEDPAGCAEYQVFVGDSMGELPLFYAASDVAFVGGSLVDVGGHNPLEPAALGLPVLIGPQVYNFEDIVMRLREEGAARAVSGVEDLARAVADYLGDANLRHRDGECGRAFVARNRGALDRTMEMIATVFPGGHA